MNNPLESHTLPAVVDRFEVGRRLGFDLYAHRRPSNHAGWPRDVLEGWQHACVSQPATHTPDRHERKWLQLRLQAHARDRAFDEAITPAWLRGIDAAQCPVTREPLTHGRRAPTDWSIDRVNNDGGYARSNLAVLSVRANAAKGNRGFEEVHALAQLDRPTAGLTPIEWMRLASLMLGPSFVTRPDKAPTLPLLVRMPPGLLMTGMQLTQHVFAEHSGSSRGRNLLVRSFGLACRSEAARHRLARLADLVQEAAKALEHSCDLWLNGATLPALLRWRDALDDAAWGYAGEIGRQLGSAGRIAPARWERWQLPTGGYRTA